MKKILAVLLMVLGLVACGGGKTSNTDGEVVIRYNNGSQGDSYDTALMTADTEIKLAELLHGRLTHLNPETQKFEPYLAESYTQSEDGLTWTFKLRQGLKWSDGSDLTAEDFKYAWLRVLDPATASQYAYMLFPIVNAEEYNAGKVSAEQVGISVPDPLTLVVNLKAPTVYFESLVAFVTYAPVSKAAVEKYGDQYSLEKDTILYSGPFVISDWVPNSSMVLTKNPYFYAPYDFDKVEIKMMDKPEAYLNAYENDEIDWVEITADNYDKYKDSPELIKTPNGSTWYVEFNTTRGPLKNRHIRRALAMAIDKQDMINTIARGIGEPANHIVTKGIGIIGVDKDFVEETGLPGLQYNPEEAKKELELGMKELGITEMPTLKFILNDSGKNKKYGETIQEYFRVNLGVKVDIELMTWKEKQQRVKNSDFDMGYSGWGPDYQDAMTFLDLFVTNGGNNHGKYSNPEYDKLIAYAQTETDKVKRFEAMKRALEILQEDAPVAPTSSPMRLILVRPYIKGLKYQAIGSDINFSKIKVEKTDK